MTNPSLGQPQAASPVSWLYLGFNWAIDAGATARLVDLLARANRDGVPGVTIVLDSTGGSPEHARYIASVMQGLTMAVHTHNVATVQSAAAIVYLAGERRFASPEATFMFHSATFGANGQLSAAQLAFQHSAIGHADGIMTAQLAAIGRRPVEEARRLMTGDRVHTAEEAAAFGIVDEVRPLKVGPKAQFMQVLL